MMISIYSTLSTLLMCALILVIGHHISRCPLLLLFQSPTKCFTTLQRCFILLSFSPHWRNSLKRSLEKNYNINPLFLTSFILINWVDLNSTQLPMQILFSLIYLGWVKGFQTSTLAFDIIQFFSLLNHQLLSLILNKASFDSRISFFFSNYLIYRKTQYMWNNFISPFFRTDVDVEQGSALSPILSALYIAPVFYIFEKRLKNLFQNSFTLSFVDGLFISQKKSFEKSNSFLFCSYNIISFLFDQFGLIVKHGKSEVFHFSRSIRDFEPPRRFYSTTKGHLETSWFYFWQKTFLLTTHLLLFQQGSFNNQGYENIG